MIVVKTILFIAFMLIVVCSSPVYADSGEMDLPSSQKVYTYSSVPEPVLSTDPSSAKPVSIGDYAAEGNTISMKIGFERFEGAADIYVAFYAPAIDPDNILVLENGNTLRKLSTETIPWKENITGPVYETLSGEIPTSALPAGIYYVYTAMTPAGSADSYYLWTTSFIIHSPDSHGTSKDWGPEVQVINTGGNSTGSVGRKLAVDSKGVIHVVWNENNGNAYDIYYSSSTDGGQHWSSPVDIANSKLPTVGPNIAVGPGDILHVAWNDRRDGNAQRIYYTRSLNGGGTWESPKDLSGSSSADTHTPSITVDKNNRVHIAWHSGETEANQQAAQIYYTRSVDGGVTFEALQRLNTDTSHHAAWPRFSVDGTNGGIVAITWRDNRRYPDWDIYLAVSTDGGRTFTERVGMASSSMEWDPDVAVDNIGVIHLSFMTYRPEGSITIDYQRSEDRGLTWNGQATLSEAISRFPFWVPDNKNNLLWLFWKDERDISGSDNRKADVAAKYSADSGLTWSSIEFVTNLGDIEVKFPSPALGPDGRTHVTWSDERYGSSSRIFLKSRTVSPLQ